MSVSRATRGVVSDDARPPFRLAQVRVLLLIIIIVAIEFEPKATLVPLANRTRSHPPAPVRVEIRAQIRALVLALAPVRAASQAVAQVQVLR